MYFWCLFTGRVMCSSVISSKLTSIFILVTVTGMDFTVVDSTSQDDGSKEDEEERMDDSKEVELADKDASGNQDGDSSQKEETMEQSGKGTLQTLYAFIVLAPHLKKNCTVIHTCIFQISIANCIFDFLCFLRFLQFL